MAVPMPDGPRRVARAARVIVGGDVDVRNAGLPAAGGLVSMPTSMP